jgi:flagellar L-ring protein precursor FlgH
MSTRTFEPDWRAYGVLGLCAMFLLAGGIDRAEAKKPRKPDSEYAPVYAPELQAPAANGAIYQAANGYSALTSGARAAMVGDVVTINLVEKTQAQKSNTADTSRAGNVAINPPTTGPLSFFVASDATASGSHGFTGKGEAAQSNALTGAISVTIVKIFANGTMLVRGEKLLTLNRGDENISISGLIRAADVGPDNSVDSTRVANARITYSGKGEIARASQQGWLNRFFAILSPF